MSQEPELGAPDDVELLERPPIPTGHYRVDRYLLRHRRFAGDWTPPLSRAVFERGHAVAVLPYDPDADAVVMIEQFRAGALAAGWRPWMTEVVAGLIDPGETPEAVARRECVEEIGCAPHLLVPGLDYMPSPRAMSETVA